LAKDLFSKQASIYAQYRPTYPRELFQHIVSFVKDKQVAWDCATGNGQAAVELAGYFNLVMATDISEKQLQQAIAHEKIVYSVSAAENTSFADNSFDCITVAQAYHWFNFEAFHKEVMRVAKPGAVIAVWGYGLIICEDEGINSVIENFYRNEVGPYWDAERKHVDAHYSTVPFPYTPLPGKDFKISVEWNLAQLTGYLNTWSSVQHFIKQNNYNPVEKLAPALENLWQTGTKNFYFPLFLKPGTI
jgi:ubiquinone/menaquinone biosynthesis C-methylase UbiE